MLVTIVVIIALFCNRSLAVELPPVPCPDVFKYEFDGEKYVGIVTVRNVTRGQTTVKVGVERLENMKQLNRLSLNIEQSKVSDYISKGQPITYRVDFSDQNAIPGITDITVNNIRICSDKEDRPLRGATHLEHTFTTYSALSAAQNPRVQRQTLRLEPTTTIINRNVTYDPNKRFELTDFVRKMLNSSSLNAIPLPANGGVSPTYRVITMTPDSATAAPPVVETITVPQPNPNESTNSNDCGKENSSIIKLAVNGKIISKSRFPWIVAIYTKNNDKELKFLCGGTLISTRSIVSAAHCFQQGTEVIPSENLMLSMGRHDLNEWENAVNVEAEKLITHPDYKYDRFDADVAIVQLKQSVNFTISIRPICLWQGSSEVIEGSRGIVVGWGEDETHTGPIAVPKVINTTIVSELTCIRSNERFFYLTSNRTLCAGNRDGSGPCVGDSGSGLMIRIGNKWMLRGAVSASLSNNAHHCNLDEYVLYSDIAKFLDWINLNMLP